MSQALFRGGFESRTICPRDKSPSSDATTQEVPEELLQRGVRLGLESGRPSRVPNRSAATANTAAGSGLTTATAAADSASLVPAATSSRPSAGLVLPGFETRCTSPSESQVVASRPKVEPVAPARAR